MSETNLQKSELVISKILEFLLAMGLQRGTLLKFQDLELPDEYGAIYDGCCTWLLDEEIIRCEQRAEVIGGNIELFSPKITSRGFALLDQTFLIGEDRIRVGQAVKEVAGGGKNYAGIGDFVGGLLGGFTKSMGS